MKLDCDLSANVCRTQNIPPDNSLLLCFVVRFFPVLTVILLQIHIQTPTDSHYQCRVKYIILPVLPPKSAAKGLF